VTGGQAAVATIGGGAYLLGLGGIAIAAFVPLRRAIGVQRRPVPIAYAAALVNVMVGVALATAMVAGWAPVTGAWAALKPAHAWLNVFGFLSVVVAATLIHLAPTVVGARIHPRRSATVALAALIAGAPLVAVGFAGGWDTVARVGAVTELTGAVALAVHGIAVWRARATWTGDLGWHRFTATSLLIAPLWFVVGTIAAGTRVLWFGATPIGWDAGTIAAPLALGWIAQVMLGSWTHLIPAIGPGDPIGHAAWRRRLGTMATTRLAAWNAGVAALAIGLPTGAEAVARVGAVLVGASLLLALGLLVSVRPRRAVRARAVAVSGT
jgi:nitrite reductase (NO-forming)